MQPSCATRDGIVSEQVHHSGRQNQMTHNDDYFKDSEIAEAIRFIHTSIVDFQGRHFNVQVARLLKLSEEVGDVAQSAIIHHQSNERKYRANMNVKSSQVASELCDVVIMAMVALNDWVYEPESFLKSHIMAVRDRVEREGKEGS